MISRTNVLLRSFILTFIIFISTTSHAAEVIKSFHADIIIEKNGDLLVTEEITVTAQGKRIKRGIYRDFPIVVENNKSKSVEVKFEILSVKRNGKTDDWHRNKSSKFTRLYIGNADVLIEHGSHVYEIIYRTDRQLRFFEKHDELIWNVTGTQWSFPIEKASANVVLPANVKISETNYFTGSFGSTQTNASSKINHSAHTVSFETTKPLKKRAGLTIGIKIEKGAFLPVPAGKKWQWFWRDYIGEVVGLLALLAVSLYYFIRWWQIGRDPASGITVPNWKPDDAMSPAMINYISNKGFGTDAWKAMTSAILNLAVKGYVVIEQLNDKPTITRTDKQSKGELPIGEAKIVDILDNRKSRSIRAIKSNGAKISSMHTRFKNAITVEHRDSFYKHNWWSIIIGIVLSVLAIIAILITGGVNTDMFVIIFPIAFGTIFISIFSFILSTILRSFRILNQKMMSLFLVAFHIFALAGVGLFGLSFFEDGVTQPLLLLCFSGILIINVLFFFLLGAPTKIGREKMDAIEGLKGYLLLAEKDRLSLAGAPTMSPQHYENLLPYAVAMGLEKPWSNAFRSWLLTATAVAAGYAAGGYSPDWYSGDFGNDDVTQSMEGMADNMASSFTASLPVSSSSSSGFSGGSSGGGGGGGGGGGW